MRTCMYRVYPGACSAWTANDAATPAHHIGQHCRMFHARGRVGSTSSYTGKHNEDTHVQVHRKKSHYYRVSLRDDRTASLAISMTCSLRTERVCFGKGTDILAQLVYFYLMLYIYKYIECGDQ